MAAVTTTVTDLGDFDMFETLAMGRNLYTPYGKCIFTNLPAATTIAAKDAADEMTVGITFVFPTGWCYRLVSLYLELQAPAIANLEDYEKGARVIVRPAGNLAWGFSLFNQTEVATAGAEPGFKGQADAVTNDFNTTFGPAPGSPIGDQVIDASQGVSSMLTQLLDSSADATSAMTLLYRAVFLVHTVKQWNTYGLFQPNLITG